MHVMGKEAVAKALSSLASGGALVWVAKCATCPEHIDVKVPGNRIDSVEQETRLESGRVVDVLALWEGAPALAVEVHVTHAVDEQKSADLNIPWIEVDATEVLTGSIRWNLRQHGNLKTKHFRECRLEAEKRRREWQLEAEKRQRKWQLEEEKRQRARQREAEKRQRARQREEEKLQREAEKRQRARELEDEEQRACRERQEVLAGELLQKFRIDLPKKYRCAPMTCHSCSRPTLWFSWVGEENSPPSPSPIAFASKRVSMRYLHGRMADRITFWVVRCLHCRAKVFRHFRCADARSLLESVHSNLMRTGETGYSSRDLVTLSCAGLLMAAGFQPDIPE